MTRLFRSALGRQARRFVQHDDVIVFVNHAGLDQFLVSGGNRVATAVAFGRDLIGQWRHADFHPRPNPRVGFHPPAIDTDIALAAHLFDVALGDLWKHFAKPTVEPLLGLIVANGDHLNPAHA